MPTSADFSPTAYIDLAAVSDFSIGALRVRPSLREVQGAGPAERLEPRVMQALVVLAAEPTEVVSREALLERCWDGRIVSDDAVNRCIAKLRKVGANHGAFSIDAVPRVGYRLVTPNGEAASAAPLHPPIRKRRWLWPAAAAAAAALTALVAITLWRMEPEPLSTKTPFSVAPFVTAKTDETLAAFASTTVAEINVGLARYRLPTAPSGGDRIEIRGDVTSDAGRLHARVRMTTASKAVLLWSAEFDAPATETARLRAEIATRAAMVAQMANEFLENPSSDFDAVTLSLLLKGADGVRTSTWDSMTGPKEAVRRSPKSVIARGLYATGLVAASVFGSPDQAEAMRARAVDEIRQVKQLDPKAPTNLVQALTMDATDWGAILTVISEAPFGDSNYGKQARGTFLIAAGRSTDGLLPYSEAMVVFGDRPGNRPLIAALRSQGKSERALATAQSRLALRPSDYGAREDVLNLTALWGDPADTLAIIVDSSRQPSFSAAWFDVYRSFATWRKTGSAADRAAARKAILAAGDARSGASATVPLLARLGDIDDAFALAEAWIADPRTRYSAMLFDPTFLYYPETAAMRRDARFIGLADELGLLKLWRDTGVWPDFCRTEPESVCNQMRGS